MKTTGIVLIVGGIIAALFSLWWIGAINEHATSFGGILRSGYDPNYYETADTLRTFAVIILLLSLVALIVGIVFITNASKSIKQPVRTFPNTLPIDTTRQTVVNTTPVVGQNAALNTAEQLKQLEQLAELKSKGALSDDEYSRLKAKIMSPNMA